LSSFSESFIPSGKQGGAAVLGKGCDIVTGETCITASLNINNLGKAAELLHLAFIGFSYSALHNWAAPLAKSWRTDVLIFW
jgi:hypothetical protein